MALRNTVPLEPWVRLAAPHSDRADVVARPQHLHDRLDLQHGDRELPRLPLIVEELPGQLGMELGQGGEGLLAGDLGAGMPRI
jgi:hypothetical protein